MSYLNRKNIIIRSLIERMAIIIVPLFFSLSELVHPVTQSTIVEEINSAKEYNVNWLVSHVFALVAILFIPFLIQRLIRYIDEKRVISSMFGLILASFGVVGIIGLLAYDFILLDAWKVGNDNIISNFLNVINSSVFGLLFLKIGPVLFLLGFLILIVLMLLSTKIKKWKTCMVLIGLLIYGIAGPLVPIPNGHILVSVGALIMLLGFIGVLFEDNKI